MKQITHCFGESPTLNFCKLCLSEKFYIIKSLNGPNLLNKKSKLVNTCRHRTKLLLKSLKKNQYSEGKWIDILFLILAFLYLMCQYVVIHSATYWHIHHFRIALFLLLVYTTCFSKSFKGIYSVIVKWSAILKGVNNLYYGGVFLFFRSMYQALLQALFYN